MTRIRALLSYLPVMALPVVLAIVYVLTNPFSSAISSRTCSLSHLSPAQRMNIEAASRALNGIVLKPGEEFSFNRAVGPRTQRRGYCPAPSYLGPDSPATFGGGICLVSSLIYQAALAADLPVTDRTPHTRTIGSIAPGLDATVWYGQTDLRFRNHTAEPLRLTTEFSPSALSVKLFGKSANVCQARIRTSTQQGKDGLIVHVFRDKSGTTTLISKDFYLCH